MKKENAEAYARLVPEYNEAQRRAHKARMAISDAWKAGDRFNEQLIQAADEADRIRRELAEQLFRLRQGE